MRGLWQRSAGGPMTEEDLLAVLADLSGQSFVPQLQQWVHGTRDLPLKTLLEAQGICYAYESSLCNDHLGLRVTETNGVRVKSVLRGGASELAGMAAGDEWLGIEIGSAKARQGWRLSKLDDLALYLGKATTFNALIARDQRLMTLPMTLPKPLTQVKLSVQDARLAGQWLGSPFIQK
jgi:predicted metalloprotease with PDZ domain